MALIDIDPQGSISELKESFSELPIIKEEKLDQLQGLPYDLIIVDTPPYLSNKLPDLFLISDYVLVPTKTGFFDVLAIRSTLQLINEARQIHRNLKAGIVLNMVKHRSGVTTEVLDLLKDLQTPILDTMIHDRVSFTRSPITGGVLTGEDSKAKEEITNLAGEIVNAIV